MTRDQSCETATLASCVDIGRNALWNYVTLIVWLRWLRRRRVVFSMLPIIIGSIGSWHILTNSSDDGIALLGASLTLLAGLLPLLYLASGVEDGIATAIRLAGGYRVLEARCRDFVIRYRVLEEPERSNAFGRIRDHYFDLKATAYTVPIRAFKTAYKLIRRGDYKEISAADVDDGPPQSLSPP